MAKAGKKVTPKRAKAAAARPAAKVASAAKKPAEPAFTAKTAEEITATFPDRIGLTAKVSAALAAENVNILAGTGYSASGMRRDDPEERHRDGEHAEGERLVARQGHVVNAEAVGDGGDGGEALSEDLENGPHSPDVVRDAREEHDDAAQCHALEHPRRGGERE